MYFARAITNAELAGAPEKGLAVLWYEYGRSSGVICDWEESEKGLNMAFELDSRTGGPDYMALYELARMNHDREMYPEAIEYFQRAYSKIQEDQADTKDPIGYADFLDEFAYLLEHTGQNDMVPQLSARSERIRAAFKGKDSHTEKTPYGTECQAGS
jgi:tetratricopeptide (TPR) repeat protein